MFVAFDRLAFNDLLSHLPIVYCNVWFAFKLHKRFKLSFVRIVFAISANKIYD